MAKVIDITEKLSFDENPRIRIKDHEFEVNGDAKTMLEIMADFSNKDQTEAALSAYQRIFGEKDRKIIEGMKLPLKDLLETIKIAISIVSGEDAEGEEQTHTMT